ncbi:MAG: DUF933 domain-containing protein [Planctomycetales bacterium]
MKIGIVGYQGSGKSTLFGWLTGVLPDPALAHTTQPAAAEVPDVRVPPLVEVYEPKKITQATLEFIDTPGLDPSHDGNAARLSLIREAGCLVHVVDAFGQGEPLTRLATFNDDLLLADLEIVTRRVEKLTESVKKPRPNRQQEQAELEALQPLLSTLEAGTPLDKSEMNDEQLKHTRSFQLLTEKPGFVVLNLADDAADAGLFKQLPAGTRGIALPVRLASELSEMDDEDRAEFASEMGDFSIDRDALLRNIMDASGQMLFFTAGEKEVRTWMIHKGGTAVQAADGIHSDLARGFVRAETMTCDDLFRLGSEREVKAENLMRREHKDYVIQDGDILHILSST